MKSLLVSLLLVVLCAVMNAQSGQQNNPNAQEQVLDCGTAGQITVVTPSLPTPISLNLLNTSVLVVSSALYTVFDAGTNEQLLTQSVVYAAGHGKAAGFTGRLISCTSLPIYITDPQLGPIYFTISLAGFKTP